MKYMEYFFNIKHSWKYNYIWLTLYLCLFTVVFIRSVKKIFNVAKTKGVCENINKIINYFIMNHKHYFKSIQRNQNERYIHFANFLFLKTLLNIFLWRVFNSQLMHVSKNHHVQIRHFLRPKRGTVENFHSCSEDLNYLLYC